MTSRLVVALAFVSIGAHGVVPMSAEAQGHGDGHAAGRGHSAAGARAPADVHAVTAGHRVVGGAVLGHAIPRPISPRTVVRADVDRSVLVSHGGGLFLSYGYPYDYAYAYGHRAYAYGRPSRGYVYPGYGAGYPPYYAGAAAYGRVRIIGARRDAAVYVDGYYVGIVNDFDGVFQHLDLEAGVHQIEIRVAGFAPTAVDVNLRPGQTITYRPDIHP